MEFNLNEMGGSGTVGTVFNSGIAGKVENVKIEVTKKKPEEADNIPNYKLIFTDKNGAQINQGFFYHKNNDLYTTDKNKANAGYLIDRIVSAAKSVVPEGFVFPDVKGKEVNEIIDILFSIIREHSEDAKVNVFATYGTSDRPSKFLGLRFFDFIEKGDNTGYSRLVPKGNDMMVRLVEDAPKENTEQSAPTEQPKGW